MLLGLLSSCGGWASHCGGFSCHGTRAPACGVFSRCGAWVQSLPSVHGLWSTALTVVVHGFSCSEACEVFPDPGSNAYLLHWHRATREAVAFFKIFIYLALSGLNCDLWDLGPLPGFECRLSPLGTQCLRHWATREGPDILLFMFCVL